MFITVIGTNQWRGGTRGYVKMPKSTILEMIGRAGRPGFDTSGVAVIMTSLEDLQNYTNLTLNTVESSLPSILVEALCAEISQTVIRNIDEAIQWLQNTFFYIRVKQNPLFYGFSSTLTPENLNDTLRKLIIK